MSGGKKKKKSKENSSSGAWIVSLIGGLLILTLIGAGGYYVIGQRKAIVGYDESVAKVTEVIRSRSEDSVQGAVKLEEIAPLIVGNPTVTRETKNGKDFSTYTWAGGVNPVGFRLLIEKNGPIDEVVEMSTLGQQE